MQTNVVNSDVSVSAQILLGDVAAIKATGFKSIIFNRLEGESADQLKAAIGA